MEKKYVDNEGEMEGRMLAEVSEKRGWPLCWHSPKSSVEVSACPHREKSDAFSILHGREACVALEVATEEGGVREIQ